VGTEPVVEIQEAGAHQSAALRTADGRLVRIHSGRDPVAEAERFVESALGALPGGAPSLVFVVSPGLGYVIEAIGRRAPATNVIAIEPFPELARAMLGRRDWREWTESKRLTLLVGPDYRGTAEAGRTIDQRAASSTTILEHPVVKRECPAETARARAVAERILEGARLNAEARRMFAGRYLLNTLRNLPALLEEGDAAALRGAFAGVPAIVVAAGPSLDANLPHLRRLADRALIVAVDTTLRPLRAAGIRPHVVVAVDPSELNARHLLGIDHTRGSWLVSEGSIDPRVFPQFAGRVFAFKVSDHQPWPWLRDHGFDRGTLRAWGSVLTTAFDLAIEAGCDPIVFAGADLAYTDGLHYARGTMNEDPASYYAPADARARSFAEVTRQLQRPTCDEVDVHGRVTTSTPQFVQFRDWLTSRAAEAAPVRVVNATGAGILHGAGITQADPATLSMADAPFDLAERLGAAWRAARPAARAATEHLSAAIGRSHPPAVPLESWIEFAADTVTAAQVLDCVGSAWQQPPVVTRQPADARRVAGANARFVAEAVGAGRVQWQVTRDGRRSWTDIEGAITPVLLWPVTDAAFVRAVFTNPYGSTTSEPAAAVLIPVPPPNDFNGDGKPDLLWRHVPTGECVVWFMDGGTFVDVGRIAPRQPDFSWRIVATGDFNGDGQVDVLWRHRTTGATVLWIMDGIERVGQVDVEVDRDPAWQIAGAADFDDDGIPDLVWRHDATGGVRVTALDGGVVAAGARLPVESEPDWQIAGVADFDGDGYPDLVWRHARTGENRVWLLDAGGGVRVHALEAEPDPEWRIASTNDFNGDGRPDLLWRNARTGENRIWLMNGVVRAALRSFEPARLVTVTPDWLVCPESLPLPQSS
jgi:hypothetical protein